MRRTPIYDRQIDALGYGEGQHDVALCVTAARPFGLVEPRQIRENGSMTGADQFATFQFWVYRIGGFMALNVLDDPAWLELMSC